jgi:putative membrane protein
MRKFSQALVIALLSTPFAASAQPRSNPPPAAQRQQQPQKKEKLTDRQLQIVAHYHEDNRMEIDLGKEAAKRGTTPAIKSYGQTLVKDHENFDKQLHSLVKQTGQKIPKEKPATDAEKKMQASNKQKEARIKKAKGANFDREYLGFMVEDHEHALASIDSHISEAGNTELATTLQNAKPVLQRHLDQARDLQKTPSARK